MAGEAKPAARVHDGGDRGIVVSGWRPHEKNSLKGFFSATLPSGLVFHDLMLHSRDGARWIAFPAREWKDANGEKQYARFVEFSSRAVADRFKDQVLDALDKHLAEGR
jgi:hypothetical protein